MNNTYDFRKSEEERECRLCKKQHKIGYVTYANYSHHLIMVCEETHRNICIPFEIALDIPSVISKESKALNESQRNGMGHYLIERFKRTERIVKPYK